MAQTADQTLEQRIADLESALRAVRTANPFGMVGWTWTDEQIDNGDDNKVMSGVFNASGGTGWLPATGIQPQVDVLVNSGRLRVDLSASLFVQGRSAYTSLSYALIGPSVDAAGLDVAPELMAGDGMRAVSIASPNINGAVMNASMATFVLEEALVAEPGWYRVAARYNLVYAADSTVTPLGQVFVPRLSVMPY